MISKSLKPLGLFLSCGLLLSACAEKIETDKKAVKAPSTASTKKVKMSQADVQRIVRSYLINHPEVSIFGMYKIQERPVIKDGELDVASFMNFTVTCDHRLIDGAEAARFLSAFIARIESPGRLMMDMV